MADVKPSDIQTHVIPEYDKIPALFALLVDDHGACLEPSGRH
jgi:hypothetical protein